MSGCCRHLLIFLSCAVACVHGIAAAAAQASARYLGPTPIEIVGESGKQSETRTIQFQTTGAPTIGFETGDLVRSSPGGLPPALIDSGQVRVAPLTPPKAVPAGFAAYEVTVNPLPAFYGVFTGEIKVLVNGAASGTIKLRLTVQYPAAQPIATRPPTLSQPMTASSVLPWSSHLAQRPDKGKFAIAIPGLPEGIEVTGTSGNVVLMSESGQGRLNGTAELKHTPRSAELVVDASAAAPGKYSGTAEIILAGGQRRLLLPVDILVRDNPWRVLLLILIGVLLGQAAKWSNERGSKIITAQDRIFEIEARVQRILPGFGAWLEPTLRELRTTFLIGQYDAVAGLATTAEARIALVERLLRLHERATAIGNDPIRNRIIALKGSIWGQDDLDGINTVVREIATDLVAAEQKPVPVQGTDTADDAEGQHGANAGAGRPSAGRRARQYSIAFGAWIARKLPPVLQFVAILLLAFVGFEAIYLNGSQTFGANPVTDYLSAVVWGLSADVAARTLLSLGRTAGR